MEISTKEAARRLGVSSQRVIAMLHEQLLTGRRVERTWLVDEASVVARAALTSMPGRPWSPTTVVRVIMALSEVRPLPSRDAGLLYKLGTEEIASKIAQTVTVRRYSTRWIDDVPRHLALTGESSIDRITREPWRQLHTSFHAVHGYLRRADGLAAVVRGARLVDDPGGEVHLYKFDDIDFPWEEVPDALIAVDCWRSNATRVRSVGIDALEEMKARWVRFF